MRNTICILILTALLAGCAGSKFRSPQITMPEKYIYEHAHDSIVEIGTTWWEIFGDTTLNHLITTALQNNQDIEIAVSRLEQARLQAGIARSQFLPTFGLDVYAEADYAGSITQQYYIKPNLSWELGFFGKAQRTNEAARAQYLASGHALNAARLSLAAQVAETYFQLMHYRLNIDISILSHALREQSTAMIDSMVERGLSSGVDLEQSRSLTATAAAAIPLYQRAAAQTSLALDVILGRNPTPMINEDISLKFGFNPDSIGKFATEGKPVFANSSIHNKVLNVMLLDSLLASVPAGLPSSLLERRPDVSQTYQMAAHACAQAGIAKAARYPSIILSGEGGLLSSSLKGLTSGNPFVWTASLELFQPLFAYGSRQRRAQIADQTARQALLEYEKTVVTALSEVEAALISISTHREQTAKLRELLRANFATKVMTDALYHNGMVGYLDVLDADRSLYMSQTAYIAVLANQFSAYITLFKALGGGY